MYVMRLYSAFGSFFFFFQFLCFCSYVVIYELKTNVIFDCSL